MPKRKREEENEKLGAFPPTKRRKKNPQSRQQAAVSDRRSVGLLPKKRHKHERQKNEQQPRPSQQPVQPAKRVESSTPLRLTANEVSLNLRLHSAAARRYFRQVFIEYNRFAGKDCSPEIGPLELREWEARIGGLLSRFGEEIPDHRENNEQIVNAIKKILAFTEARRRMLHNKIPKLQYAQRLWGMARNYYIGCSHEAREFSSLTAAEKIILADWERKLSSHAWACLQSEKGKSAEELRKNIARLIQQIRELQRVDIHDREDSQLVDVAKEMRSLRQQFLRDLMQTEALRVTPQFLEKIQREWEIPSGYFNMAFYNRTRRIFLNKKQGPLTADEILLQRAWGALVKNPEYRKHFSRKSKANKKKRKADQKIREKKKRGKDKKNYRSFWPGLMDDIWESLTNAEKKKTNKKTLSQFFKSSKTLRKLLGKGRKKLTHEIITKRLKRIPEGASLSSKAITDKMKDAWNLRIKRKPSEENTAPRRIGPKEVFGENTDWFDETDEQFNQDESDNLPETLPPPVEPPPGPFGQPNGWVAPPPLLPPPVFSSSVPPELENGLVFPSLPSQRQEEGRCFERAVTPDGDCGATAMNRSRHDVYELLVRHIGQIRERLTLAVKEELLLNEFLGYLRNRGLINLNITRNRLDTDEGLHAQYANDLTIIHAYLEYAVRDKLSSNGWLHFALLQALAVVDGLALRIWEKESDGRLIPCRQRETYHRYNFPTGGAVREIRDVVFVHNRHYNVLNFRWIDPEHATGPIYPQPSNLPMLKPLASREVPNNARPVAPGNRLVVPPPWIISSVPSNQRVDSSLLISSPDAGPEDQYWVKFYNRLIPYLPPIFNTDAYRAIFHQAFQKDINPFTGKKGCQTYYQRWQNLYCGIQIQKLYDRAFPKPASTVKNPGKQGEPPSIPGRPSRRGNVQPLTSDQDSTTATFKEFVRALIGLGDKINCSNIRALTKKYNQELYKGFEMGVSKLFSAKRNRNDPEKQTLAPLWLTLRVKLPWCRILDANKVDRNNKYRSVRGTTGKGIKNNLPPPSMRRR